MAVIHDLVKDFTPDITLSPEQIKVAEWKKNRIDGLVKFHESLGQFDDGFREILEKVLNPEWSLYNLFDKAIISLETYLSYQNKTDLEKIALIDSFDQPISHERNVCAHPLSL